MAQGKVDDHDDEVDEEEEEGEQTEENALDDPPVKKSVTWSTWINIQTSMKQLSNPPGTPSDKLDIAARERRLAWVFFFIVNNPEQNRNDSDCM